MKATATVDFTASMSGCDIKARAGEAVEADARTIEQLEAIGLVTTKKAKRVKKEESDD